MEGQLCLTSHKVGYLRCGRILHRIDAAVVECTHSQHPRFEERFGDFDGVPDAA
jgi:hypothetical protein